METYKLSIKERLQEGHKLLYAVCVDAPSLKYERLYDPNAKAKAFNSEDSEFDTSFSIVHPFRNVAAEVVRNHFISTRQSEMPRMEYVHDSVNNGFNEQRQRLFENILEQEYQRIKKEDPFRAWK
ncbi:MAG: hypothetical protein AABX24_04045 [Nanoarchaeota archaeon]